MKKADIEGMNVFIISDKEFKKIQNSSTLVIIPELSSEQDDTEAFLIDGQKVIYNMIGLEMFLFESVEDCKYFVDQSSSLAENDVKYDIQINDKEFIENIDLYIALLESNIGSEFNFSEYQDLIVLDKYLNSLSQTELSKFQNPIIAVIGQFICENLPNAKWYYLDDEINLINPVILDSKRVIPVIPVVQDLFKENRTGLISFYENLEKFGVNKSK